MPPLGLRLRATLNPPYGDGMMDDTCSSWVNRISILRRPASSPAKTLGVASPWPDPSLSADSLPPSHAAKSEGSAASRVFRKYQRPIRAFLGFEDWAKLSSQRYSFPSRAFPFDKAPHVPEIA